jgi:hypothetical protein
MVLRKYKFWALTVVVFMVALLIGLIIGHSTPASGSGPIYTSLHPLSVQGMAAIPGVAQTADSSAPTTNSATNSLAYPYPGPTSNNFTPGYPPFSQNLSGGDGLSSWGVAYRKNSASNAVADNSLIKAAVTDARDKAQTLAGAADLHLGNVVAISDYVQNSPFYNCPMPLPAPGIEKGAPGPALGAPTGSGFALPVSPSPGAILQPSCNSTDYVVVWVIVRYKIN